MLVREYTLRFLTPAFLGNAEQGAQWRSPPLKALLRQWWRVAYAEQHDFRVDVAAMRHQEGLLFGHAWLEKDEFARDGKRVNTAARKSAVRIRLGTPDGKAADSAWARGTQKGVAPLKESLDTGYAWFGLVKRGDGLPDREAIAIKSGEDRRRIALAFPEAQRETMETTVRLLHRFGQLGSRSRGGWGSLVIEDQQDFDAGTLASFGRSLDECLTHDWPMSLSCDAQGTLHEWESSKTYSTWEQAMAAIAGHRKQARLLLKSFKGADLRPVLGFASPGRMPSPLRWRVFTRESGKLGIRVFAMPTRIPDKGEQPPQIAKLAKSAWLGVFDHLDGSQPFRRSTREAQS